jgi:hypothetical protein
LYCCSRVDRPPNAAKKYQKHKQSVSAPEMFSQGVIGKPPYKKEKSGY